jgi:hypothetical protein
MVNYFKNKLYVPTTIKKFSEAEAAYGLRQAWKKIYGNYPNNKQLSLLWAQSALETGRWKIIRNYNFGNIKKKWANPKYKIRDDGHKFTMFATGENLWNHQKRKSEYHWFEPPHIQTHFRAYDSLVEGAEDYIRFVSQKKRYKKAWQEVLKGNPTAFSHELKLAGYYTAAEEIYTKGVVRLTKEFLKKADVLLGWVPEVDSEPPEDKPEEIFTEWEKQQILDQVSLSIHNSIEEYFANSNNKTPDDNEDYYIEKKPWYNKILGW